MWSEGGYYYDAAYAISELLPFNEQYLSFGYGKLSFRTNVVSPENTNYNLSTLSLIFMVNNPVVWMGYSLNGQDNATVIGNTMLSIFPTAFTPLRFYARDEFGNTGDSEIVGFTTKEEPFPTALSTAIAAIVIFSGLGLVVYYKKRKR